LTARTKGRDRRLFPRVSVYTKLRILLRHQRSYFVGDVGDISAGGLGIMAKEPLEVGTLLDFEFTLLDEVRPYVGRAEVVWVKESGGSELCPCLIGLRFVTVKHKKRDLSMFTREVVHWRALGLQMAVDSLRYAWAELHGNLTARELGEPGGGFRRPLLMIHGWFGTRGSLGLLERRLKQVGFPVFSVDLGTPNVREIETSARLVTEKVVRLTARLGIEKIDILGHSMGGLIGLYAIKKLGLAPHVHRFVAVGAPFHGTYLALAGVTFFGWMSKSIWQMAPKSEFLRELHRGPLPKGVEIFSVVAHDDLMVSVGHATLDGARNVLIEGSHASLVTSDYVFQKILAILEGRDPFETGSTRREIRSGAAKSAQSAPA
jgi:pimeloyl-ACP methyl ester carboxylesterase